MRADGQTDVMKLIVAFGNLEKVPKNTCCHSPSFAAEGGGKLCCNWHLAIPKSFSRMFMYGMYAKVESFNFVQIF